MPSAIKVLDMTKTQMGFLAQWSTLGSLLSVSLAFFSIGVIRFYSIGRSIDQFISSTNKYVVAEISLQLVLLLVTFVLAMLHTSQLSAPSSSSLDNHRKFVTVLLVASATICIPTRAIADLLRTRSTPNIPLLCLNDALAAISTACVLLYLWCYPALCAHGDQSSMVTIFANRKFTEAIFCTIYVMTRLFETIFARIHFSALPLQSCFALFGLYVQDAGSNLTVLHLGTVALVSILELGILIRAGVEDVRYSRTLKSANDFSLHQNMIALRYFHRSAFIFYLTALFVSIISAFATPRRTLDVLRNSGRLVLPQRLGNLSVALLIFLFCIRDIYVHHSWETLGSRWWKEEEFSEIATPTQKKRKEDLIYRVFDHREASNESPIPQEHAFSLESATLLFNMSWLSQTKSGTGSLPLTPADFGRPAYSLMSQALCEKWNASAIVLQGIDRIIVAFKPVAHEVDLMSNLRVLSKTKLGQTWCSSVTHDSGLSKNRLFRQSQVHCGYATAYCSIQDTVIRQIRYLLEENARPIYITGYSSGGALATLCCLDVNLRFLSPGSQPACVYTYGSPKVMNSSMVKLYEQYVPFRWRCVVSGDSMSVQPMRGSFRHYSRVATFTRNAHLAIELRRSLKWWQSRVSAHPMHKLSSYYCAFAEWHKIYHVNGCIDLWDWPVEASVKALFRQHVRMSELQSSVNLEMDSPTADVTSKSLRNLELQAVSRSRSETDDVVAFSR